MKVVTAVLRPHALSDTIAALQALGISGGTVSEVSGYGQQKGHSEIYRGAEYETSLVPKIRIELLLEDGDVDTVVATLTSTARTGRIGDGKIWVTDLLEAVRVRTGERGSSAL